MAGNIVVAGPAGELGGNLSPAHLDAHSFGHTAGPYL